MLLLSFVPELATQKIASKIIPASGEFATQKRQNAGTYDPEFNNQNYKIAKVSRNT